MKKIVFAAVLFMVALAVSASADTYGPTTSIISPIDDTTISKNSLRVLVQVWDTDGIHATTPIEISIDAGAYSAVGISDSGRSCVPASASCTIYLYTWDLSAYGDNTVHSLSARTKDTLNQTTTKSVSVTVRNAKTGDGNLLSRERADQLCIDCHNVASHSSQATDTGYGNWSILCTDCHTPHNTKNIMTVKDNITTPNSGVKPVQFYNRTGDASNSFVSSSAGADTKGVCQVCHTQTKDPISSNPRWRNSGNSDPAHYASAPGPTQTCTICHPHAVGFKGDCNLCHNSPPGASTGKHATHVGAGATIYGATAIQSTAAEYRFSCGICHNGTHINTVGNPHTVEVNFAGIATQDPASGSASYAAGSFSVDDPGRGLTFNYSNGTCSNIYCHGNYPGSGKNASPTFGAASTASCGSCHEASNATVPASGTHKRHASAGTITGATSDREYACTLCHNGIVSGSGPSSYSIADKSKHVSGFVDWAFDIADPRIVGSSAYSVATGTALPSNGTLPRAYGTCNNIYCHSIAQTSTGGALTPDTADYKTPTWGSTVSCGTCHKGDMGHNFGNLMDSGSHTRHLEYDMRLAGSTALKCTICHKWNAAAAFADCNQCHLTAQEKTLHVNRSVNVAFDTFFGNGTYSGLQRLAMAMEIAPIPTATAQAPAGQPMRARRDLWRQILLQAGGPAPWTAIVAMAVKLAMTVQAGPFMTMLHRRQTVTI